MSQTMTDVQRVLWQGWHDSEMKLGTLLEAKPVAPPYREGNIDPIIDEKLRQEWSKYRDDYCDWNTDWTTAIGFRDGMHHACVLAGVPNFKDP